MRKTGSKSFRAWQCVVVGTLGMLSLPVCNAAPRSLAVSSDAKKDPGSAPVPPATVAKPVPTRAASTGARTIVRKPGETPEQLGARILPTGADTFTKPLEFELGPLGKVVLVL